MTRVRPLAPPEPLAPFAAAGLFGPTEVRGAERLVRLAQGHPSDQHPLDLLSAAVALWAPLHGHVCADLDTIARRILEDASDDGSEVAEESPGAQLPWPGTTDWLTHLQSSPLVARPDEIGTDRAHPDETGTDETGPDEAVVRPLVLDGTRLYLSRQWGDEGRIADALRERFRRPSTASTSGPEATERAARIERWIDEFLADDPDTERQRDAVRAVLAHNTTVLLGGPGTGKTHTIAAMLHALVCEHEDGLPPGAPRAPLRVALAAPTNKAARQIHDSIEASLSAVDIEADRRAMLSSLIRRSTTLHGLLGMTPSRPTVRRHHRLDPLPFDVVIVDEVSMLSLSMMSHLLDALDPATRLVLVGDSEQLRSVENGAVLPEIARVERLSKSHGFPLVRLTYNWRQQREGGGESAIAGLAEVMRSADSSATVVGHLGQFTGGDAELRWIRLGEHELPTSARVVEILSPDLAGFSAARLAAESGDCGNALGALESVRILCAHRRGDHGVSGWNGLAARVADVADADFAVGQPVLNTHNDPRSGLVNGDIGIVARVDGKRRIVFRDHSGLVDGGAAADRTSPRYHVLQTGSLEDCETCFAMTVHKAQGSQYDTVIAVVPPVGSPLLLRELLYTAVTRAVRRLVIVGSEAAIRGAVERQLRRESGLAERLLSSR